MITHAFSKPLFDQMHTRMNTDQGKDMMKIRKSTVEPVIGTLVEYLGMRKINTKGIRSANKCMLLAGIAYNLKKLLKYSQESNTKEFLKTEVAFWVDKLKLVYQFLPDNKISLRISHPC